MINIFDVAEFRYFCVRQIHIFNQQFYVRLITDNQQFVVGTSVLKARTKVLTTNEQFN
ncbi:hypothetical protein ACWATR_09650 [Nostoc sp. UIC 10890]